jgi:hypothetical protein
VRAAVSVAIALAMIACAAAKQDEAEAVHLGQLGSCVDRYSTREGIDSCRASVEKAWGRYPDGGRIPDGGAE